MPKTAWAALAPLLLVGPAAAGKFDKYKTCADCIDAGWGWNVAKNKCGAFPNKVCPESGGESASVALPAYEGKPLLLTQANFDDYIKANDIVLVEFFAPWCGHCKKLEQPYTEAAALLHKSHPNNVRLVKVDATDEANTDIKTRYGVTGFPMCFVFRQGEKLYKTLDDPKQRTGPLIAGVIQAEAAQPPPPPPGAPIFMKFTMQGSAKLMEHKIKSQIALFYKSGDSSSTKLLKEFEQVANEYAGKIIALYIDVDDSGNNPVLGRFAVGARDVPCMRVAQIYPEGMSGMSIYMPDKAGNAAYQDTKPTTAAAMSAFVADHLAEPRRTKPYLRSDRRPSYVQGGAPHPDVVDLLGNTYDDYVMDENKHVFSFFFMQSCPHCKEFTPSFEAVAAKLTKLNPKRPSGEPEIKLVRMNTVRNDVGHEKIFTGSYPTFYWLPGKSPTSDNGEYSKENPLHVNTVEDFTQDEEGLMNFLKERTWLGSVAKDEL